MVTITVNGPYSKDISGPWDGSFDEAVEYCVNLRHHGHCTTYKVESPDFETEFTED